MGAKNAKMSYYNGMTLSGRDILINHDTEIAHKFKVMMMIMMMIMMIMIKGWWDNKGFNTSGPASPRPAGQHQADREGEAHDDYNDNDNNDDGTDEAGEPRSEHGEGEGA